MWIEKSFVSQAVGTNLAEGEAWQRSNRARKIVRMAVVGGAAAEDAYLEIFYGTTKVARIRNNFQATTTFNSDSWMWHTSQLVCPRGVPINVFVVDAATSATATVLFLDIQEV